MIYSAYDAHQRAVHNPLRVMADLAIPMLSQLAELSPWTEVSRGATALAEMVAWGRLTHERPDYGIHSAQVNGESVAVCEEIAYATPFGSLLHFKKASDVVQPRVLVVAPLSGHFATLLRGTVTTLLDENDVYITDWHNARDIPPSDGRFGYEEYVDHVVTFFEQMGPGAHMVAVCQPCAHALTAVAVMAMTNNPAAPRSMTLMAGPIDTRINPTKVNTLATEHSIDWFERNLISTVPLGCAGAGRRVYPGFVQLCAFMTMNPTRHLKTSFDLFDHIVAGKRDDADTIMNFYDEYFAVLDLTAEFYLETVNLVFQEHVLPKGELTWRGEKVDLSAIRRTALLTVEGERDDICSVGQTLAAQDLCTRIKPAYKKHHLQPGVGHYGVFSGSKWQNQIYPLVRNLILSTN